MTYTVYTRHAPDCPKKTDKSWRRCRCPKWLYSYIGPGSEIRKTAKTRSWDRAEAYARKLEAQDAVRAKAAEEGRKLVAPSGPMTIDACVDRYLEDKRQQNLSDATLTKATTLFKKQFCEWAKAKGLLYIVEIALEHLEDFRKTWKDKSPLSRKKKQERLIGFLWFCLRHGWIKEHPGAGLSRVRADDQAITLYFNQEEFAKVIDSTYLYNPSGYTEPRNQATRLRVLTLLMRWSGLSIRDAITLERRRLNDRDELFLYRAKTGVPVFVKLPPDVADALRKVPPGPKPNPHFFFWTGNGDPKTAVADWQRSYVRLFNIADLRNPNGTRKRCFPHMFRDTFAIELLLAGVPLDQVSILLGHKSIKTTEKHYAPFVKARQEQLVAAVQKAWPSSAKKQIRSRAARTGR